MLARSSASLVTRVPRSCEVVLDDCRVPAANLLGGEEGHGFKQVLCAARDRADERRSTRRRRRQRALGASRSPTANAKRSDKPIGQFPGHPDQAGRHGDRGPSRSPDDVVGRSRWPSRSAGDTETGMAKLFASEIAIKASLEAMRIHGGVRLLDRSRYRASLPRRPLMAIGEGTSDILAHHRQTS